MKKRLDIIPKKKPGKRALLALGFKECGRPYEFKKKVDSKQIHIKWEYDGCYAGYYVHIDKYPHV